MAQQYNEDPKPDDLKRILSREYEDHLDWLENQTPQPELQAPPHRGLLAALRDFLTRLRRPASHLD